MATILCVADEPSVVVALEHTLSKLGHRAVRVSTIEEAATTIARSPVDLIIADHLLPRLNSSELLRLLEKEGRRIPVIVMTESSSIENAVRSIKSGALDYLLKPIRSETLEIAVDQALETIRLRRENESLRSELRALRSPMPADAPVFNLDEIKRGAIDRALTATGGNRARAAKLLGISERTLRNKLNAPKVATPDA